MFLAGLGLQEIREGHSQVHDHALVDLLPQVGPEDLDERDLEGGNLPVHENAGQIQLHLEPYVHIGSVDCGAPPQREAPVGDLVQPRALGVGQLLVLHGLLKATGLQHRLPPDQQRISIFQLVYTAA